MDIVLLASEDLKRLEPLVSEFCDQANRNEHFQVDLTYLRKSLKAFLEHSSKTTVIIGVENDEGELTGFLIGFAAPSIFAETTIAAELALYTIPGSKDGLLLIEGFEMWAEQLGCSQIAIGASPGLRRHEAFKRFLRMDGFKQKETVFYKELSQNASN